MKLRENQMAELEKKEAEVRARLKQQQQMYEAVRADRNLYSKNLIEAQDEIAEMKRKFKIMNHQVSERANPLLLPSSPFLCLPSLTPYPCHAPD